MGEKREGHRKKEERFRVPEENQLGVLGPAVFSFVFQRLNKQDIPKKATALAKSRS
jgi:hypothetical protein